MKLFLKPFVTKARKTENKIGKNLYYSRRLPRTDLLILFFTFFQLRYLYGERVKVTFKIHLVCVIRSMTSFRW